MELDFSVPRVMGILNITPDSFSDGGNFLRLDDACRQAEKMILDGVDIIDVGGESTRPGAEPVGEQQEIDRVVPIIETIRRNFDVGISVDTSKAGVMLAAVNSGADMINDVCALRGEGALQAAAELSVPCCLMHMQGEPRSMQANPQYVDVVEEVLFFLNDRISSCIEAGILRERLVIDPGIGFGKSLQHNLRLLKNMNVFVNSGFPVLLGVSRKSMFGHLLGLETRERLLPSVLTAVMAVQQGVKLLRVHDVKETVQGLKLLAAMQDA